MTPREKKLTPKQEYIGIFVKKSKKNSQNQSSADPRGHYCH